MLLTVFSWRKRDQPSWNRIMPFLRSKVLTAKGEHDDAAKLKRKSLAYEIALYELRDIGVLGRDTVGDGNCGVETDMVFAEGNSFVKVCAEAPDAPRSDILVILDTYRKELMSNWNAVSELPFWQQLWTVLQEGKVVMDPWFEKYERMNPAPSIPPASGSKNEPGKEGTPERPQPLEGRASLTGCRVPQRPPGFMVPNIPGQAGKKRAVEASGSQQNKIKPTGKPFAPALVLTFPVMFERFLSEHGFTWRKSKAPHAQVMGTAGVRGKLNCRYGQHSEVVNLLGRGEWPECEGCLACLGLGTLTKEKVAAAIPLIRGRIDKIRAEAEAEKPEPLAKKAKVGPGDAQGAEPSQIAELQAKRVNAKLEGDEPPAKMIKAEPAGDDAHAQADNLQAGELGKPAAQASPDDRDESQLDKGELISLHGLVPKPKNTNGHTHPVFCTHCSKYLQGRNKAKVWQHVSGQEHRARWAATKRLKEEDVEEEEACKQDVKQEKDAAGEDKAPTLSKYGACDGLVLNSELGRQTRLGSNLKPVWTAFAEYAVLDTTEVPERFTSTQVHTCSTKVIRHYRCQPGGISWQTFFLIT